LENLDSSELVEEHMSIKSENNYEDFDEESCTIDDDDLNSNTETEGNSKVNELQILYHGQKWIPTWLPSMRILTQNKNSKWRLLI
jgi:hypothetical protein